MYTSRICNKSTSWISSCPVVPLPSISGLDGILLLEVFGKVFVCAAESKNVVLFSM